MSLATLIAGCAGGAVQPHQHAKRRDDTPTEVIAGVRFGPASSAVATECQTTADAVGYAVPCPQLFPLEISATPAVHGCHFAFVAEVGWPGCDDVPQNGWFFGSSQLGGRNAGPAGFQHLAIFGAPRVISQPSRMIDGPGIFPAPVKGFGVVKVGAQAMHWYFVPPDNPSAFRGHLVLLWSSDRHTYVYGFHVTSTRAAARLLDLAVASHLRMIEPH